MGFATEGPGGLKAGFEYADGLLKANGRVFDAGPLQVALSGADRRLNAFLGVPVAVRETPKAGIGLMSDAAPAEAPGMPPVNSASVRTAPAAVNALPSNNALPPNNANTSGPVRSPSPPNSAGPVNSYNAR